MCSVFPSWVMTFKVLTDQIKMEYWAYNCDLKTFSQNFLEAWMMHTF